jgi:integrase
MAATHRELKTYLAELEAAGRAGSTRHKTWQTIGAFYRWAATPVPKGPGLLTASPMERVLAPHIPVTLTARIATVDQAHVLEAHYARHATAMRGRGDGEQERALRNAAMVSLMMRSGLRSSDVVGLDIDDIMWDGGEPVAVWVGGDDGMRTKNRRRRLAPIVDETPKLLRRYLRRRGDKLGPLFIGRSSHTADSSGRLKSAAVQRVVRRAADACGIEVSCHDLRRGFAVESARRGVDRGWIKSVAGWSNDQMLDRYLGSERDKVAVEQFRTAIGDARLRQNGRRDLSWGESGTVGIVSG